MPSRVSTSGFTAGSQLITALSEGRGYGEAGVRGCFLYYLVEARNLDEVIDIAGRIPGARKGTVEIRPVLEIPRLPAD